MKVSYIHHSGFAIELEKSIYIFDYYKKEMPDFVIKAVEDGCKDVYFFSSHGHSDHFNPDIFGYENDNVYFLLSKDIEEKVIYRGWLDGHEGAQVEYIEPYQAMNIQGKNGSILYVETLKSTDRGVAFLVTSEGKTVYHAGDLNNWIFDGLDKAKLGDMKARYTREIDKIKDRIIEVAFLPVDYRLGEYFAEGPVYFLKNTKTTNVFPMHMWKEYEYIDKLKKHPDIQNIDCCIYDVDEPGKCWKI